MKDKLRQSGLSLTEMTVVISTIALLTVFGIPAIRAFVKSFETEAGVRGMINAALSNARAIAAKETKSVGVRFQQKWQADNKGCQYMIFIIHDKASTGYANGFRAVPGTRPIKLPDNIGVMDLWINETEVVDSDEEITNGEDVNDMTAFSIVFSPSGKLVIHDVRVTRKSSNDDIFNAGGIGMFVEDDGEGDINNDGFAEEPSRREFIIYDRSVFDRVNDERRWTDYLKDLAGKKIHMSPYTGRMID